MRTLIENDVVVPDISLPTRPNREKVALSLLVVLYGVSFFLEVFDGVCGAQVFFTGAIFSLLVVGLPITFPWLANPFYWRGMIALYRGEYTRAATYGAVATMLAGSFVVLMPAQSHRSTGELGLGYWTWLGSIAGLPMAALWFDVDKEPLTYYAEPRDLDFHTRYFDAMGDDWTRERIRKP